MCPQKEFICSLHEMSLTPQSDFEELLLFMQSLFKKKPGIPHFLVWEDIMMEYGKEVQLVSMVGWRKVTADLGKGYPKSAFSSFPIICR